MKIFHNEEFSKNLKRLPKSTQKLYKRQEKIFLINWRDPRLHSKRLKGDDPVFSFRITRKYRVLFRFADENSVLFVSIGHRKDIYD